ncbi:hypothetical protein [Deinococcus indicus]|uniref:hypothetical protein n=1 Tax=Deinococcus indicus TaxID=223556 RepID=UPI001178705F|nr:hypothetical protein [Deinococcus indicus]
MRHSPFRNAVVLSCLLLGAGSAVTCEDLPESLLDVRIGADARGAQYVKINEDTRALWLLASALTPAERRGYGTGEVSCPEGPFVILSPDVPWSVNAADQVLTLQPRPERLGRHTINVTGTPGLPATSGTPVWQLGYTTQLSLQGGDLRGGVTVEPGYRQGPWEARATATLSSDASLNRAGAWAAWQPDETVRLKATVGGTSELGAAGTFNGVHARTGRTVPFLWPELKLTLPFDAQATVQTTGGFRRALNVPAGEVSLLGIPLTQGSGRIVVTLQDPRGQVRVEQPYIVDSRGLAAGSFDLQAELGAAGGALHTGVRGALNVTDHLTVAGTAQLTGADGKASVTVDYAAGHTHSTLGLNSRWNAAGSTWTAQAASRWNVGPVTFGVRADLPDFAPGNGTYTTLINWQTPDVLIGGELAYVPQTQQWSAAATGTWFVTDQAQASLQVSRSAERLRARAQVLLRPSDQVTLRADTSAGTMALGAYVQVDPQRSVGLHATVTPTGQQGEISVRQQGPADITGRLTSAGQVNVVARGTLIAVAGNVFAATTQSGGILLVRTGVPGIRLNVSALGEATTNAEGDAAFLGAAPGGAYQVTVVPEALPFEVTVGAERQEFTAGTDAVTTLDWRPNFTRNLWVTYVWPVQPPGETPTVEYDGELFALDAAGATLIPQRFEGRTGILRDGTFTCTVPWPRERKELSCSDS